MMLRLAEGDMHSGALMLVNADHPVKEIRKPALTALTDDAGGVCLEAKAAATLNQLLRDIGHVDEIAFVSGYRPYEEQEAIYRETAERSGEEFTRKFVALPGRSEHQTGLAIDLGEDRESVDFICPEFPDTGMCGRFRERAARYGFILRYTGCKEGITGISSEPWHFRYVGFPHSEVMRESAVCLEEYIDLLKDFREDGERLVYRHKGRRIEAYFVPAGSGGACVRVPENTPYQVSGNNVDGFVVTVW